MRFSGKSAIITGGAKGIGAVYAKALAAEGANVVIADIVESEGEELAHELDDQEGAKALFVRADVTDDESVTRMTQQAADSFGNVDILVNNAAIYGEIGTKSPSMRSLSRNGRK